MVKVVVNKCFGGFGLSALAYKRLAELEGKTAYFFKQDYGKKGEKYIPISLGEAGKGLFFNVFSIPNPNEVLDSNENWNKMTLKQKEKSSALYEKYSIYDRDMDRDNKNLVQVVEELGEKASGQCGKLEVVEVPDDVEWEISEYDGLEHVAEKHRTW